MNRLAAALIAYAVLGVLTWMTISDTRIRAGTLVILALFAVKSWIAEERCLHPGRERDAE